MGTDKALLELAGKPLVLHAVTKLRRLCQQVSVLSDQPQLGAYAPLVPDVHPGCGPIGGIEAALLHSAYDWTFILPVDVPFLPTAFLDHWLRSTLRDERRGARASLFTVEGVPQPTLLMAHKDLLPFLSVAIERGEFKLFPVLDDAGKHLAEQQGILLGQAFRNFPWTEESTFGPMSGFERHAPWLTLTDAQQRAQYLWFANLNTPEEFAGAQQNATVLDT
jgi:molybdenum cofactor guanylyltransferase